MESRPNNCGHFPSLRSRRCRNRSSRKSEPPPAAAPWCTVLPPNLRPTRGRPFRVRVHQQYPAKTSSSCFLHPVACDLSPIATVDSLFLILGPTSRRNTRRLAPGLLCRIGNYPFFNCDENASSGTPGSQYRWRFQWLGRVPTTAMSQISRPAYSIGECRNSRSDVHHNATPIAFADFDLTG